MKQLLFLRSLEANVRRNYCASTTGPDEGLTWWRQYKVGRKWLAIEHCTGAIDGGGSRSHPQIAGSQKDKSAANQHRLCRNTLLLLPAETKHVGKLKVDFELEVTLLHCSPVVTEATKGRTDGSHGCAKLCQWSTNMYTGHIMHIGSFQIFRTKMY